MITPPARAPLWSVRQKGVVLTLRNEGIITLQSQMEGRYALRAAVAAYRPGAVCVDLRGAVMALSEDDWQQMAKPEFWRDSLIERPVAYVVSSTVSARAKDYCAQMFEHGLLRMIFTQMGTAFSWCERHALRALAAPVELAPAAALAAPGSGTPRQHRALDTQPASPASDRR